MSPRHHLPPTQSLTNGYITLEYLEEAGPRIVSLKLNDRPENILAVLPENVIETEVGDYHIWGGHRIWHAPEAMPRTYVPDDGDIQIEEIPRGVRLTQPVEALTGIQKIMEIELSPGKAEVTLRHTLINKNVWTLTFAPWSITQLNLGGIAVIPQPTASAESSGLLPNRQVVFWPYSSWQDPRFIPTDEYLFLQGDAGDQPFKVGTFNRHGWLGYLNQGVFFIKHFVPDSTREHPDRNCNTECYIWNQFIELESLGALKEVYPGEEVEHVEIWELHSAENVPHTPEGVRAFVESLEL
jgi:hypothetical protein